ncbi:MAG: histidine phosphatase family protein [bacterium]
MPTVFLVRHGETDWNRSGQIMGARPVPLNERGRSQAQRLARHLQRRPVEVLYSSPVARAIQTAHILSSALEISVRELPGLTEIGVGEWEGLFWKDLTDEIVRRNLYAQPKDTRFPGGETLLETQGRAVAALETALREMTARSFLFVSHADVIRSILAHYLDFDLQRVRQIRIDNASVTGLELNGGVVDLLFLNYLPEGEDEDSSR